MSINLAPGHTIPVLDHGYVRYVDHLGTDQRIVEAARISYKSPSKGDEQDRKLLNFLWKNKHTSPFEMCKITLNVKMPIFVMRQWVRHRMQNLNEVSARYTELPEEFYIPNAWRRQDLKNKQGSIEDGDWNPIMPGTFQGQSHSNNASQELMHFCHKAYKLYQEMLAAGISREMARFCLPVNIYTEIYCCWDLKNLLHFLALREDAHAQSEIREYGAAIKQIMVELFPWTMAAYEESKKV